MGKKSKDFFFFYCLDEEQNEIKRFLFYFSLYSFLSFIFTSAKQGNLVLSLSMCFSLVHSLSNVYLVYLKGNFSKCESYKLFLVEWEFLVY